MKKILSFFAFLSICAPAIAITAAPDRRSSASQWTSAPRAVASQNQINANKSSIKVEEVIAAIPKKDMREAEKKACIGNNIGVGNTFVWASKYSNTGNYSSMIEDIEEPINNVCFVKVELKSADSKISVADVLPVYFEMGRNIICGAGRTKVK